MAVGSVYFELNHHFLNESTEKTVRWSFLVKNQGRETITAASFSTYAPVKYTASQDLLDLSATHDFEILSDAYSNQVMTFSLGKMPPLSEKVVTITAKVRLFKFPRLTLLKQKEKFLGSERFIELDDKNIQELSKGLDSFWVEDSIKAIFKWVNTHIQPLTFVSDDRGASYALKNKIGDCTEFMYLFLALSRLSDIPASGVGGWVVSDPNQILRANEYHNWAQYYHRGRWRMADALNNLLDQNYTEYLAFRIFGKDEASPMNNTHRFVSFSENLLVRMN